MSVEEMRRELMKAYSGNAWKQKVMRMPEGQVAAVYLRLKSKGKV